MCDESNGVDHDPRPPSSLQARRFNLLAMAAATTRATTQQKHAKSDGKRGGEGVVGAG